MQRRFTRLGQVHDDKTPSSESYPVARRKEFCCYPLSAIVFGAQDRRNLPPFLNHAGFTHQAVNIGSTTSLHPSYGKT